MVPDVGFVIVAEKLGFVVEYTRILSDEPTSTRLEDSDHKNQEIEAASSDGRDITRVISRDRVARMLSLEGRTVAMNAPSGLGRDWVDAGYQEWLGAISYSQRTPSYTSMTVRTAFWRVVGGC